MAFGSLGKLARSKPAALKALESTVCSVVMEVVGTQGLYRVTWTDQPESSSTGVGASLRHLAMKQDPCNLVHLTLPC